MSATRRWFIDHGVGLLPIAPGTKKPASAQSWTETDFGLVTTPAYGVKLGSLVVADGDSSQATAWIRANLPPTPFRVQTGPHHDPSDAGRGVHFYYVVPRDVDTSLWPGHIHRDGLSIEIRRSGNYVLGPDSPHPSGAIYTATRWAWKWRDITVFPTDIVWNDGSVGVTPRGEAYEVPEQVMRGEGRVPEMFRYVRSLKGKGSDAESAAFFTWQFNLTRCEPPRFANTDEGQREFQRWFRRAWGTADTRTFTDARREQPVIAMELGL